MHGTGDPGTVTAAIKSGETHRVRMQNKGLVMNVCVDSRNSFVGIISVNIEYIVKTKCIQPSIQIEQSHPQMSPAPGPRISSRVNGPK